MKQGGNMAKQTDIFQNVIGIFQGGGAKAAAYAGVISAADELGVNFVGAIGASAGSIIAALICAGCTAEKIHEISQKNLSELVSPPKTRNNKIKVSIAKMFGKNIYTMACLYYELGLHSPHQIESWINKELKESLGIDKETVLFKHLRKPLAILSADIKDVSCKVWSNNSTPDTPVAHAVMCSCCIPFYFQPVERESCYIDGGVIANLPIFLQASLRLEEDYPALCFRLCANSNGCDITNGYEYALRVIDTVLSSVTEVQFSNTQNTYMVTIPTGEIETTKSTLTTKELDMLADSGSQSLHKFIENEKLHQSEYGQTNSKLVLERDRLLIDTIHMIGNSCKSVKIIGGDFSWIEDVYPALIHAARKGVSMHFLCSEKYISKTSHIIQSLLSLGSNVYFTKERIHTAATLIDVETGAAEMQLIEGRPHLHGRRFSLQTDPGIISHMDAFFDKASLNSDHLRCESLQMIRAIEKDDIIRTLTENVRQYRDCKIQFIEIDPRSTKPLTCYLNKMKIERVRYLDRAISERGEYCAVVGSSPWFITPPIVEVLSTCNQPTYVVIDGNHRIYNAIKDGVASINVVCVEECKAKLPAVPINWDDVKLLSMEKPRIERYKKYDDTQFRETKKAFAMLSDQYLRYILP